MATKTKIHGKWNGEGNRMRFFDSQNENSTTLVPAGVWFMDHFIGKAIDVTNTWTLIDALGAGETLKADQPGGVVELALTAAVEVQLAGIGMGDERQVTIARGPVFEARVRFTTLMADVAIAVIGLAGDHNATLDTVAESCWFRFDGSGAVTVENDDTSHETSKVATGTTVLANIWHTYKIDMANPADVKFYIDGSPVGSTAASTTFNMNQVTTLQMQPYIVLSKAAAGTNLGVMEVDYISYWQNLS
jgi:hypothetical protein